MKKLRMLIATALIMGFGTAMAGEPVIKKVEHRKLQPKKMIQKLKADGLKPVKLEEKKAIHKPVKSVKRLQD